EHPASAPGARAEERRVASLLGREPACEGRAVTRREAAQLLARRLVVERGQDQLGQPVPRRQRQRRDHTTAAPAGGPAGADAVGSWAFGTRSTRVPAIRSWSARLSRRSAAIR